MNIKFNKEAKKVEIWVDSSEKQNYKNAEEYKSIVSQYKDAYSICVFVGGTKPLLPTITTLLDAQMKPRFANVS